jgi:hypothetical protein
MNQWQPLFHLNPPITGSLSVFAGTTHLSVFRKLICSLKINQWQPLFTLEPTNDSLFLFAGTVHLSVFRNLTRLQSLNLSRNHLDENWIKVSVFLMKIKLN